MAKITIIDHPLIKHKMTQIRQKETKTKDFLSMCSRNWKFNGL